MPRESPTSPEIQQQRERRRERRQELWNSLRCHTEQRLPATLSGESACVFQFRSSSAIARDRGSRSGFHFLTKIRTRSRSTPNKCSINFKISFCCTPAPQVFMDQLAPPFPMTDILLQAYRKWETEKFPVQEIRVGASSAMVQKV